MSGPAAAALPSRLPGFALSLVSAGALAYEILLTRLFSIVQWHHFAYMSISVALLGYGAAGMIVALLGQRGTARFDALFVCGAAGFGLSSWAAFRIAERLPFNALAFLWDPVQPLLLAAIYALLFVPFFCAALCVCLVFARHAAEAGRVYGFDILGGAAGALGIVLLLVAARPERALDIVAALGFAAAALAAIRTRPRQRGIAMAMLVLAGLAAGMTPAPLRLSPYKMQRQTLEIMGTRVRAERSGPLGLLTVVESPQVPLRYAPGLSPNAPGEPPPQLALFTDGESLNAFQRYRGRREELAWLDWLGPAAVYALGPAPRTLILGAGTGTEILQAKYHDARAITAVELNPDVVKLVEQDFGDWSGRPYALPGVTLAIGEARGYVAAHRETWDLIQIPVLEAFGASSAGLYALSESYLYTVESLATFLDRLAPGGYLSITRWVSLPPRDVLKLAGMAARALERRGVHEPGRHLALVRSMRTVTLLVRNEEIEAADVDRLKAFCKSRSFDLDWYPGIPPGESNRYNRLEQSWYHDGLAALTGPAREDFIARYKFDLTPATDDRPYFFQVFRWRTFTELLGLKQEGGLPLVEWGYLLLVATLVQAVVASLLLIGLPLAVLRRRMRAAVPPGLWLRAGLYFASLGAAFMFVEMAFIQKFMLFLSHPLYAVAVVLFAFLFAAGLGGRWSARFGRDTDPRGSVLAIALLTIAYLFALPPVLPVLAAWPDAARIAIAGALVLPLGFAMGIPMPLGIRALATRAGALVPWVWGVNACSGVISTVLATLLAIRFGFDAVLSGAVALYVLAALCFVPAAAR